MAKHLIARLLRPVRAGIDSTAWYHPAVQQAPETIALTSSAFTDGEAIPVRYAGVGVGDNISPPLNWSGVPTNAAELVLVIEDPDVPLPRPIVHGVVTGINPRSTALPEGAINIGPTQVAHEDSSIAMTIGTGAFRRRGYAGPRPIPGHGPHRYVFQLFALDRVTGLGEGATLGRVMSAIDGHVLARGKAIGIYERA
ncbi:YbhB/YbcL family Raf kinase inhibitor-like protein [Nocardia sp. ET3-3]|uniref:YbhB/YbcL family Raf kinase inhibitor-like protein n=1 Tax=Nocardia terrae TaxID=2675851 RepID=A0A7K1US52_9NOCA|nr:YbhB/YbcL family Raf kinase inhibitor-like protein [Nocardia terrae]MVU77164.1 YbhB/YbcL family Raf kinase inhibitor-like protein [Nocardia terrae]